MTCVCFQKGLSLITRGTNNEEIEFHKTQMVKSEFDKMEKKTNEFLEDKNWNMNSTSMLATHSDYSGDSFIHSLMFACMRCRHGFHSLTHSLTYSLTHPLTHSPTDSLTHPLTCPPTHSSTYPRTRYAPTMG